MVVLAIALLALAGVVVSTTMLMGWPGAAFAQETAASEESSSGGIAAIHGPT